jgi:hypothetical protein
LSVRAANISTTNAGAHSRAKPAKSIVIRLHSDRQQWGRAQKRPATSVGVWPPGSPGALFSYQSSTYGRPEWRCLPECPISKPHIDTDFGYLCRCMAHL